MLESAFTADNGTYTIIIGAGGSQGVDGFCSTGYCGGNTCILNPGNVTAIVGYGGGGGSGSYGPYYTGGCNGGSGGGGGRAGVIDNGNALFFGTGAAQGYPGGCGPVPAGGASGGGGGAGQAGFNSSHPVGAVGGNGRTSNITGNPQWYAGGGSGNWQGTAGYGSTYGGGGAASAGVANKGGGGSGGPINYQGAAGGSGIAIISYPGRQIATGGDNVYSSLGNTVHIFCSSGTLSFNLFCLL
jgi:hypothetical protein